MTASGTWPKPGYEADTRLSASSISANNGEPGLLYSDRLDDPAFKFHVAALALGKDWDAAASLKRVLEGLVGPLGKPPKVLTAVDVYAVGTGTAAVKPFVDH